LAFYENYSVRSILITKHCRFIYLIAHASRVYLSAQVLKTGVVLADLPGLQDTNLARVRATQTYLMKCDNVFIVAKISRAITDQSLKSSLYSILDRHARVEWEESGGKSFNLAVVCTKSEVKRRLSSLKKMND
jgi:hypothetical protein